MPDFDELKKRHDLRTISSGEIRWLMSEVARLIELNLQLAEQVTCEHEHTRVARMQREELAVRLAAAEALLREACEQIDGCVPGHAIAWDDWYDRAKEICGDV